MTTALLGAVEDAAAIVILKKRRVEASPLSGAMPICIAPGQTDATALFAQSATRRSTVSICVELYGRAISLATDLKKEPARLS